MSVRTFANIRPAAWLEPPLRPILEAQGHRTALVAFYLLTSPVGHMSGLYLMPSVQLAKHLRMTPDEAERELQTLINCRFIQYDWDSELVWVVDAAKFQVWQGRQPNSKDNRTKGVESYLRGLPAGPLVDAFRERYPVVLEVEQ